MRRIIYLNVFVFLIIAAGCQNDKPKPETKLLVQPVNISEAVNEVPVSAMAIDEKEQFFVSHKVKGKNIFIECFVPGITFRNTNASNKGSILLYVDGKLKEKISSAAFIVKGLSSGSHQIKIEVVKDSQSRPLLAKEFYVTIP